MGELAQELRSALGEEFASLSLQINAVRDQMAQLARGQSALASAVENINQNLVSSSFNPEPSIAKIESQVPKLQHRRSTSSIGKEEGTAEFAKLYRKYEEYTQKAEEGAEKIKEASFCQRFGLMSVHTKDLILDSLVAGIVVLNAIFIGISSDNWNGELNIYFFIDALFTVVFFIELVTKVRLHGISYSFCHGSRKLSNIFDLVLVIADTLQLLLVMFFRDATDKMRDAGVPSASLFRVCRVLHVARILRLLRHPVFEELLAMFEAVVSGLRTLVWAIVLFVLVVFVVALLCRDVLGNDPTYTEIFPYFSSVPRSFFTVFRCSFGDCSSKEGTPIPESVHKEFGVVYSLFYCICLFFIMIGLFNIISAIFVDRTMIRAARMEAKHITKELMDEKLWATRVSVLVRQCFIKMGHEEQLDNLEHLQKCYAEIPVEIVDDVCRRDPQATAALSDLGIDEYDHINLAKLLDYDHSGTVHLSEFIHGLQAMRGLPRRSDIVSNCLLLQGIQGKMADMRKLLTSLAETSSSFPRCIIRSNDCDMSSTSMAVKENDASSTNSPPIDAANERAAPVYL